MTNIGSFKKVNAEFQGEIVTLSVQAKNLRLVLETNRTNDNPPSHGSSSAAPIMRSAALCGAVSFEALSFADFAGRSLRIIPDARSRGAPAPRLRWCDRVSAA